MSLSRIQDEIDQAAKAYDDWSKFPSKRGRDIHIAVMSEPFLSYVFSEKKTVESRFSLHKIAPYQKVQPGDTVFMKAGPIVGGFEVGWVRYIDLLEHAIEDIAMTYGADICGNEVFWKEKANKRYVTLLGISNVQKLTPLRISKFDRRAWITIPRS